MLRSAFTLLLFVWSTCISLVGRAQLDTNMLKKHVEYLASDELQGRESGTEYEKLAAEYIAKQFQEIGLVPAGDAGYSQDFKFNDKLKVKAAFCKLEIDKQDVEINKAWYPLPSSGSGQVRGKPVAFESGALLADKVVLVDITLLKPKDPHAKFEVEKGISSLLEKLHRQSPATVIFGSSEKLEDNPSGKLSRKVVGFDFPVAFTTKDFESLRQASEIGVSVLIEKEKRIGRNVMGFLNNSAERTIIIGGHYDHLGLGGQGSLYSDEKPAVHNGADDNASGTALVIELARYFKQAKQKNHNYLFMAYGAEEKGLLGSNYYSKNPLQPLDASLCMINFDMVGRLDSSQIVGVNGVGTAHEWDSIMALVDVKNLKTKTTQSGIGASDHTSFYLKNIPVLHYFSGTHGDYHKPSDDIEKINYVGINQIGAHVIGVVEQLDRLNVLSFQKKGEDQSQSVPRFKVTLGVIPDYLFDGEGMRIESIREGRPAQKAGLKNSDIVLQIGKHKVKDMMSYMRALSKFEKGDKAVVEVERGEKRVSEKVVF